MALSQAFAQDGGGSLQSSGNTLGEKVNAIGQQPYVNQVDAAAQQTANLNAQAAAARQIQAPQIVDPTAAASRRQIGGVLSQYGTSNAGLRNVISGGGPNAGTATTTAGTTAGINAGMMAAHGGTGGQGGYSAAGADAAQGAGSAATLSLAQQAAAARGGQITAAQGAYGSNLNAMGGLALQQGQTQEQTALANAGLSQEQGAMDTAAAQTLYGQGTQEQGVGLSATDAYFQQQQAAQQAAIKQQEQDTKNDSSVVGDIGTGIGDAVKIASIL